MMVKSIFSFSHIIILATVNLSSANAFILDKSDILLLGKEFSQFTIFWFDLTHTIPTFNTSVKKPFENIVGKEENAGNQHFLFFPQCFFSS